MNNNKPNESELPEYNSNPFTLSFKGFGLLAEYAKNILIIMIIFSSLGLIMNIFSYIPNNSNNSSFDSASQTNNSTVASEPVETAIVVMVVLGVFGIILLMFAVGLLVSAAYKGFVAAGTVSAMNKKTITVGEAFTQMKDKLKVLFIAEIITTLKIIGGYILFVVPGIRAQLRYQSTPYIIMANDDVDASKAIEKSKHLYRGHLMEAFGIATVGAIIPFIGQAIMASGMTLSVNQITAYKKRNIETPKTHWLNYLGLLFILAIFLFIVITVSMLMVVFSIDSFYAN